MLWFEVCFKDCSTSLWKTQVKRARNRAETAQKTMHSLILQIPGESGKACTSLMQ